jgi:hypothetical protein
MTPEQVSATALAYERALDENEGLLPVKNPTAVTISQQLRHVAWMCQETRKFVQAGETEKAMRWLGFIQGTLWSHGVYTIGEMREHNMPTASSPT